jgi:hypothetical protein
VLPPERVLKQSVIYPEWKRKIKQNDRQYEKNTLDTNSVRKTLKSWRHASILDQPLFNTFLQDYQKQITMEVITHNQVIDSKSQLKCSGSMEEPFFIATDHY